MNFGNKTSFPILKFYQNSRKRFNPFQPIFTPKNCRNPSLTPYFKLSLITSKIGVNQSIEGRKSEYIRRSKY